MATIYLKYDDGLQYSVTDDEGSFEPMGEKTITGDSSGEEVTWQISRFDSEIEELKKIVTKNKKSFSPSKGHWKDTWEAKPKKNKDGSISGTPVAPDATKEDPAIFAYDIVYVLKNSKGKETTLDPNIQVPQP